MRYDTTKRNINWNGFNEAKQYIEKRAKVDEFGNGECKIMHNTRAELISPNFLSGGKIGFVLHWTEIYSIRKQHDVGNEFPHSVVQLDSGGHRTVTTKDRINRFLPLGYRLFQKNWNWYVETPSGTIDFVDGMEIKLNSF